MNKITEKAFVNLSKIKALIFDLDGVVTQTAKVHANAWQQMFEEYLERRHQRSEKPVEPYENEQDYNLYLDGKPRYEGVSSFLESRGIKIPYGTPDDTPDTETVCGLGNRKNRIFLKLIDQNGVDVFKDSVDQIHKWKSVGLKTAIVSSSKNCEAIIQAAKISDLFDTRVDGRISEQLNLKGKPAPDIFIEAAEKLKVKPSEAAIFEDAISGVQAGKAGQFRYVVGVARRGQEKDLLENGADIVIKNLYELNIKTEE